MFFDNLNDIEKLASKTNCTIFVIPDESEINIKNARVVEKEKANISIEQIRTLISETRTKQKTARYIIIKQAEKMTLEACNAFLKSLEEPSENYHFILQTENLSSIIPTILSRAEVFVPRVDAPLDQAPVATDEAKTIAKRLIAAKDADYIKIMNDITKKKDDTREFALEVLGLAIEISYKSFFKTNNPAFLKKIPNLIETHKNIAANGNIKLHLVADML